MVVRWGGFWNGLDFSVSIWADAAIKKKGGGLRAFLIYSLGHEDRIACAVREEV